MAVVCASDATRLTMELTIFVLCAVFGILSGEKSQSTNLDGSTMRCVESCLKINPYDYSSRNSSQVVKHCAKLTPDGKCECDWEKIVSPLGGCVCRNPLHTINSQNHCVCDLEKCEKELTKNCTGVIKKDPFECCPVHCETCPDDSFFNPEVNECICYPCEPAVCNRENQTLAVVSKGLKKPGRCCDLYKCEGFKVNCEINAGNFTDGDSWVAQETCEKCRCDKGVVFCDLIEGCRNDSILASTCLGYSTEGAKVFQSGETWMRDSCTKCICENGRSRCFPHFCEDLPSVTVRPEMVDCPILSSCKKTCAFGFKLNKKGCEMCKCKLPEGKVLLDILRLHNCTLEKCDLRPLPAANCTKATAVSGDQFQKGSAYAHFTVQRAVYIGVIVFLVALVIVLLILLCRSKKRGDLSIKQLHSLPMDQYVTVPAYDGNQIIEKKKPKSNVKLLTIR